MSQPTNDQMNNTDSTTGNNPQTGTTVNPSAQQTTQAAPTGDALPQGAAQSTIDTERGGMPGDGVGRRDDVGQTGVYPLSADTGASEGAPIVSEPSFGQGDRGAQGYNDSGDSETEIMPPQPGADSTLQAEG